MIAVGRPADLVVLNRVEGSQGPSFSDSFAHGDFPGISQVFVDGVLMQHDGRSGQTPPPARAAQFGCCNLGWLSGKPVTDHHG